MSKETKASLNLGFPVHRLFVSSSADSYERSLAILLKSSDRGLLWQAFAKMFLQRRMQSAFLWPTNPVLVPAPSSTGRYHAHHFAKALSEFSGWEYKDILSTVSVEQKGLSKKQRLKRSVYLKEAVPVKPVIFVDDLLVTGATAKAAKEAFPVDQSFEVWALTHQILLH